MGRNKTHFHRRMSANTGVQKIVLRLVQFVTFKVRGNILIRAEIWNTLLIRNYL